MWVVREAPIYSADGAIDASLTNGTVAELEPLPYFIIFLPQNRCPILYEPITDLDKT